MCGTYLPRRAVAQSASPVVVCSERPYLWRTPPVLLLRPPAPPLDVDTFVAGSPVEAVVLAPPWRPGLHLGAPKTIPGVWLPADQARPTAAVHVRPGAPGRVNCPLARSWLYPCPNVHLVPGKWPDPKGHLTIQASSDGQLVPLDQRSSGPAGCRHCTPMPRQPAQGRQSVPGLHHPLATPWPYDTMAPWPHGPTAAPWTPCPFSSCA